MRLKLLLRRLSISAPRMIVRSHLPWPLRWIVLALMLGFSAALALWAFEFGREIAGLDRGAKEELASLRSEVAQLRAERERFLSSANTVDSLLRAERAAQAKLSEQLKHLEAENHDLKDDVGFYERLLPAAARGGLSIRALQGDAPAPGQVRYRMIVMQPGRSPPEFAGRYEVSLAGTLDGRPWVLENPTGPQPLKLKQVLRIEGAVDHAPAAMVKTITVKVFEASGAVRTSQTAKVIAP
jgi:cell division protein FtsB